MRTVRIMTYVLLAVTGAVAVGINFHVASKIDSFVVAIALWTIVPHAVLAVSAAALRKNIAQLVIILLGSAGISGFGIWGMIDSFFVNPDAQSGLVLLFIPIMQLPLCIMITVVAWAVGFWPLNKK